MASDIINNTLFTGKFLIREPVLASTNQFAHNLISKTKPIDGTVIITDHQFEGKGQGRNSWNAEAGKNITCSIIYDTSFLEARQPYFLNMAVANGLCDLAGRYLDQDGIRIKWPNDLLYKRQKLAGILIENTIKGSFLKYSVIGIGLNVNQEIFEDLPNATSIKLASGKTEELDSMLENLCVCVERQFLRLRNYELEEVRTDYNDRLFGRGEEIKWSRNDKPISGIPMEVNANGQLVANIEGKDEVFNHGEIQWSLDPAVE